MAEASLPNTSVHDKHGLVGLRDRLNLLHFIKESGLLLVTTRGINDDNLVLLFPEEGHALLCDFDWVSLVAITIERALNLGGVLLQLLECAGPKRVSADETDAPAFFDVVVGILGAGGRLTSTLQANKHHYVLLASHEFWRLVLGGEHVGQLVDHSLRYELLDMARRHFASHLKLDGGLDRLAHVIDVVDVDIGVEKSGGNFCEDFIEDLFVDLLVIVDFAEGCCESLAQFLENHSVNN